MRSHAFRVGDVVEVTRTLADLSGVDQAVGLPTGRNDRYSSRSRELSDARSALLVSRVRDGVSSTGGGVVLCAGRRFPFTSQLLTM